LQPPPRSLADEIERDLAEMERVILDGWRHHLQLPAEMPDDKVLAIVQVLFSDLAPKH
jgi:hypothetical protein